MEHSPSQRRQQDELTETTDNEVVDVWQVGTDLISKDVRFRKYDLLEEGARMFLLIEGDALVADLINNPFLDFKHGGQFLHLTFLLERFIKEKALRGAQLVFIFFQCFEQTLYSKRNASHDWKRLLVRRLVLTHLSEELKMPVKIFKNWWADPNWAEYLRRVRPPLIAICTEIDRLKSIRCSTTALRLLRGFFLHCLDAGMRCVAFSSMKVHGPALNAFIAALDTFTTRKKVKMLMPGICESIRQQQQQQSENQESRPCPLDATKMRSLGKQLLAVFQPFVPAHEALAMAYMSLALMIAPPLTKMNSTLSSWTDKRASHEDGIIRRVLLLSLIIKHGLSLKARAQPLTNMPCKGGKGKRAAAATSTTSLIERGLFLLDQVYKRMLGLLPQQPEDLRTDWWPPSCHLRLHDLFDGRLFCVLLERLCGRASDKNRKTCTQPLSTLLGLSSSVLDVVSSCWKILFPAKEWNIVLGEDVLVWLQLKTSEGALHSVSTVLIPSPQNQEQAHHQQQNQLCQRCLTASKDETFDESSQDSVPDSWEDIEDDHETEMKKQSEEESSNEFMLLHNQQPLFPIHHRLADVVMGQELIKQWAHYDEQSPTVQEVLAHRERFLEMYHWHSLRKLDDTRKRPGYFQRKKLIDNQSTLHRYSESLKLNRSLRTITVEDTKKNKKLKRNKQLTPAALAMKEAQMKKSQIKIVRQLDGQYEEILEWVRNAQNDGNYELCLKKLDEFLQSAKDSVKHCKEANLHKLLICRKLFVRLEPLARRKQVAVDIFTLVHNIYSSFNAVLSTSDCQCLIEALQESELCTSAIDLAEQMVNDKKITEDHFAQLHEVIPTNGCKSSDSILFQLQHAGEAMEWEKQPHNPHDSTRYGFMPDEWQREMIRVVDENKSMLVCAPTSSGKTFIGFYAIETVLRRSDSGVVVFVCPTKALVNQVYAEIYATFRKTFKEKNQALLGLFTADMKINPTTCSVLVTVPQCLQILLLSPKHGKTWARRLEYVILDEAHSIGERDSGGVWQNIFALINCPFMALSATIGNPQDLVNWMRELKQDQEVVLIQHHDRVNQLVFHFYDSSRNNLIEILPSSIATEDQLAGGELLAEWRMMPHQCFQLYQNLADQVGIDRSVGSGDTLSELGTPRERFAYLSMMCLLLIQSTEATKPWTEEVSTQWQKMLFSSTKAVPEGWLHHLLGGWVTRGLILCDNNFSLQPPAWANTPSKLLYWMRPSWFFRGRMRISKNDALFYDLSLNAFLRMLAKRPEDTDALSSLLATLRTDTETAYQRIEKEWDNISSFSYLGEFIGPLIELLNRKDKLPAIIFNFDRFGCNILADKIAQSRTERQKDQEIEYSIDQLDPPDPWMSYLFYRGIGVHHSGIKGNGQQEVERLFRERKIDIIVATGTLALGIHMPCRTVVFAGNSPYLNSLMFRQMSGRAGRRGFDTVGNVVVFGLPYSDFNRLMFCPLPKIIGSMPLTTTLTLQLMMMVESKHDLLIETAQRVLTQPFFVFGQKYHQQQLKHHFRFSLEYLMQEGHIDNNGNVLEFAGLVTHTHYLDPANYAFVHLLRSGLIHKLVHKYTSATDLARTLMFILCHLFYRLELPIPLKVKAKSPNHISKVILEPLPEEFTVELQKYNSRVMEIYTLYVKSYAKHCACNNVWKEETLSLSGLRPSSRLEPEHADNNANGPRNGDDDGELLAWLKARAIRYDARSGFVANSGHGDEFLSEYDLVSTVRDDIALDTSCLPTFTLTTKHGKPMTLNSYLLDFLKHGQQKMLVEGNGILEGQVDRSLRDFSRLLAKLTTSIEERSITENDMVLHAFKVLREEFNKRFQPWFYKKKKHLPFLRVECNDLERFAISGKKKKRETTINEEM